MDKDQRAGEKVHGDARARHEPFRNDTGGFREMVDHSPASQEADLNRGDIASGKDGRKAVSEDLVKHGGQSRTQDQEGEEKQVEPEEPLPRDPKAPGQEGS